MKTKKIKDNEDIKYKEDTTRACFPNSWCNQPPLFSNSKNQWQFQNPLDKRISKLSFRQAKNGLQLRSGSHGISLTVMDDCHGQLSWMTFMDDFHDVGSWFKIFLHIVYWRTDRQTLVLDKLLSRLKSKTHHFLYCLRRQFLSGHVDDAEAPKLGLSADDFNSSGKNPTLPCLFLILLMIFLVPWSSILSWYGTLWIKDHRSLHLSKSKFSRVPTYIGNTYG